MVSTRRASLSHRRAAFQDMEKVDSSGSKSTVSSWSGFSGLQAGLESPLGFLFATGLPGRLGTRQLLFPSAFFRERGPEMIQAQRQRGGHQWNGVGDKPDHVFTFAAWVIRNAGPILLQVDKGFFRDVL